MKQYLDSSEQEDVKYKSRKILPTMEGEPKNCIDYNVKIL